VSSGDRVEQRVRLRMQGEEVCEVEQRGCWIGGWGVGEGEQACLGDGQTQRWVHYWEG
jgi:hypothetical protein